jgi:DNA-binding SARP family transcriptional activator/DNA-binding beta-propeller fold protein YncE
VAHRSGGPDRSFPTAGAAAVTFGLLGPFEVRVAGTPLDLGSSKQKVLLVALLLQANRSVSVDHLVDELWLEPPATAMKSVQVYVSRLRRLLGEAAGRLQTAAGGYRVLVEPGELDVDRFEALTDEARRAMPASPLDAAAKFREALAIWRGRPLSDLATEMVARGAIPRLDELRLTALEGRIDADLAAGREAEVVGELGDLVDRNPYRERFCAQLMLALYRCGRQADALAAYGQATRKLAEDLGLEPTPDLQRLQEQILRHDPALSRATSIVEVSPPPQPAKPVTVANADPRAVVADEGRVGDGRRRRLRTRALLAAGTATAVLAIALPLALSGRAGHTPPGSVRLRADSVAMIDPASGAIIDDLDVGSRPGPVAALGGSLWVGNIEDRTVTEIDLANRKVVRTYGLPSMPASITVGPGVVWVGDGFEGTISRILTAYGQVSAPFFPGPPVPGLLAVGISSRDLWVGLADDTLLRLDPGSLHSTSTIRVPDRPRAIAPVGDAVWTVQFNDRSVDRVDPARGTVAVEASLPGQPVAIAVGDGYVWVATSGDDHLWKLDQSTGAIRASTPLGVDPSAVAVQPGVVWVIGGGDGVLERIDPRTGDLVRTARVGRPIGGLAVGGGNVWLTIP